MNNKLFKKSFDLKSSKVSGGVAQTTWEICETATNSAGCTDMKTEEFDDNGTLVESCTNYQCE